MMESAGSYGRAHLQLQLEWEIQIDNPPYLVINTRYFEVLHSTSSRRDSPTKCTFHDDNNGIWNAFSIFIPLWHV